MEGTLQELWTIAKQSGPLVTFLAVALYLVNAERKEALKQISLQRDKHDLLIERVLTGLNESTNSLKTLADLFKAGRRE